MLSRRQVAVEQASYLQAVAYLHMAIAALKATRNTQADNLLPICASLVAEAAEAKLNHNVDSPTPLAIDQSHFFNQKGHNYMAMSYGIIIDKPEPLVSDSTGKPS